MKLIDKIYILIARFFFERIIYDSLKNNILCKLFTGWKNPCWQWWYSMSCVSIMHDLCFISCSTKNVAGKQFEIQKGLRAERSFSCRHNVGNVNAWPCMISLSILLFCASCAVDCHMILWLKTCNDSHDCLTPCQDSSLYDYDTSCQFKS